MTKYTTTVPEYSAEQEYRIREKRYSRQFDKADKEYNILSNLRLGAFLGIILGVILYYFKYRFWGSCFSVGALVALVLLVIQHEKVKKSRDLAFLLAGINRQALDRITGQWVKFIDNGAEYVDSNHQYSLDLDIFGPASVFQWINNTFTFWGRSFLQKVLVEPEKDILILKARQAAINELAGQLDWRQYFLAEGSSIKNEIKNPESLLEWAENENYIFRRSWLRWGIRLISAATSVSLLSIFLIDQRFLSIAVILLITQLILYIIGLKFNVNYGAAVLQKDAIATFQKLLTMIEREDFESKYLSDLKSSLIDTQGNYASQQINKLAFIVEMMSYQHSQFSFLLNMFFLLDYHCMFALEKWKRKSGPSLRSWLTVIGKLEEISSLAVIRYDNPEWASPQFTDAEPIIFAQNMGHPLLFSPARVCNDINIKGSGNVFLITGSNMSGKSTWLRTVGVNLVLAYTGAPVCAGDFKCSIMDIYTVMRVNDNLEKNLSSFYAELLKIKNIIQKAGEDNSIIFLLDEIFKGTNSKDRHIGAATVVKKLSKMGAVGLVSTHDLELGELEKDKDIGVENYHFSESYLNNQIVFDYKLRTGVSKTTNAIHLMKMVGIDEAEV